MLTDEGQKRLFSRNKGRLVGRIEAAPKGTGVSFELRGYKLHTAPAGQRLIPVVHVVKSVT